MVVITDRSVLRGVFGWWNVDMQWFDQYCYNPQPIKPSQWEENHLFSLESYWTVLWYPGMQQWKNTLDQILYLGTIFKYFYFTWAYFGFKVHLDFFFLLQFVHLGVAVTFLISSTNVLGFFVQSWPVFINLFGL